MTSAIDFVAKVFGERDDIVSIGRRGADALELKRNRALPDLLVGVISVKWPTAATVERILNSNPDIQLIVNSGKGCHAAADAAGEAMKRGSQLLTFRDALR